MNTVQAKQPTPEELAELTKEKTPRKPPTYKLTWPQLCQQVIELETTALKDLGKAITAELDKRKIELQEKLRELE
jgi:hypothetical protein